MIRADLLKVLNDGANSFIGQIRANMASTGTNATGKTSRSLSYEISENGTKVILQFFGRDYFATVETGRKATPDKKPSRQMIDNIKAWCAAKGKPESAAWAIATYIQKHGTDLFRKGGRKDIYTNITETFADQIFQEISETIASEYFRKATVTFSDNAVTINKQTRT